MLIQTHQEHFLYNYHFRVVNTIVCNKMINFDQKAVGPSPNPLAGSHLSDLSSPIGSD